MKLKCYTCVKILAVLCLHFHDSSSESLIVTNVGGLESMEILPRSFLSHGRIQRSLEPSQRKSTKKCRKVTHFF